MAQPQFVHREIWLIAFPMLLTGISTPLLGMVDTAVVGHLPDAHFLAAVALGAMIFNFLFWALGFLRMGTTSLTARSLGEENEVEKILILQRGLLLAILLGVLLIVIQEPLKLLIFNIVDTTDNVSQHAQAYFEIRIWAAPATLATYVLLGWFLGLQKPRLNLLIVVSINLINILLDVIFVVYFDMNSSGVAWATLIAEYIGLALGLYCIKFLVIKKMTFRFQLLFHVESLKTYLSLNLDVFLRTLFLLFSFSFFTLQSAKYGPVILAANAVLMNLQTFMAYALDSLAHAAEVLVGKYHSAKHKQALILVLKITCIWSVAIAALFVMSYWSAGNMIVALLTNIDEVKEAAIQYLPWLVLSPLLSVWSFWFDGIFIGAGFTRAMRNTMLFSFAVFIFVWFLLTPLGNHGLWAALMCFMLARALSMAFVTYKKRTEFIG